jgi:hypothetical protein
MWTTLKYQKAVYVGYVKTIKKSKFGSRVATNIRHGSGTMTYNSSENCCRSYYGSWWDDRQHGRGTEHRGDGLATFVGEYRNGSKHGRGVWKYINGNIDKGIWKFGTKVKTIMRGNTKERFDT